MHTGVTIKFDNDLDDIMAFARYHREHSPHLQRVRKWTYSIIILICVVFASLVLILIGSEILHVLIFAIVMIAVFAVLAVLGILPGRPGRSGRFDKFMVQRLLREGANKTTFGTKELEIADAGLVGRSSYVDETIAWQAVERVAENKNYAFIYISATTALVIPRAKVTEGDCDSFVEAVKQKLTTSRTA
jgi:hypothetical protein